MEQHEISELLNDSPVSKFATRNWIEGNDLSESQHSVKKNIRFKTPVLRSDLSNYNEAHFVVKGRITVAGNALNNRINKRLVFKNNAPVRSGI